DASRLLTVATILKQRCSAQMRPDKRRVLDDFLKTDRSLPGLLRLGARGARELAAPVPETLGAEWMLFWAFAWRRMLTATTRDRPARRIRFDAVPPPSLVLAPGREAPDLPEVRRMADKLAPLRWSVSERAPRRVNLLIPTIDLKHFFAGYIGKFN